MSKPVYKRPEHLFRLGVADLISNFRKSKPAGRLFSNPSASSYDENYLSLHELAQIIYSEAESPGLNHPYFITESTERLDD